MVDGDKLTLENRARQRRTFALQDYPVLWGFVESIRATLGGDIGSARAFLSRGTRGRAGERGSFI